MALNAEDVQDMVTHWLGCPPNGYLGSDYGSDVNRLLQAPFAAGEADALIAKLRTDVPLLGTLPSDVANLYAQQQSVDKLLIGIDVAGTFVLIDEVQRGSAGVSQV